MFKVMKKKGKQIMLKSENKLKKKLK